jgi:aminoglycoside phosphotransferase
VIPSGFFPALEPEAPVAPLVERLVPAVRAELERHEGTDTTVHAELRVGRTPGGGPAMQRFYWSTQRADPASPWGFSARTLFCGDDPACVRVHAFPSDPALTWLADDPGPLLLGGRPERVDVLRYIPLRRLTFRLHDGAGLPATVIAKSKRTSGLNRAATAFLAVHLAAQKRRTDAPRVPRVLRHEPPRHVLHLEQLPGETLAAAIGSLDLTAAMQQLGTLHRSLQELPVRGLTARRTTADWLEDARAAVSQVGLFVPSAERRAAAVHAGLARTAPADGPLLFCQGDFLPGQVLCDPSGWSVIDFDDSRYADPLSEVAAMHAGIPRELHLSPDRAEHAQRTYVEAYAARAGAPLDRARWRWYQVLLELVELGKRLTKGRVAPGETHAVLDRLTRPDGPGSD